MKPPEEKILRAIASSPPTVLPATAWMAQALSGRRTLSTASEFSAFLRQTFCSSCHAVAGAGGFIAPDLTTYAQAHSAERIKAAILDRAARDSILETVTLTDEDGKQYRGIIRNEDNFSLQLQSFDGSFHFLAKSALKHIDRDPSSLMPDYRSKLTSGELDDVVSYLHIVGAGAKQSQRKERDEQ